MYINPHEEEDARGQSSSDYKVHFYAYDKRSTLLRSRVFQEHTELAIFAPTIPV